MTHSAITRAFFFAGIMLATAAHAGNSDVRKCVAPSGQVTLTDDVCPSGSQTAKVIIAAAINDGEQMAESAAPTRRPAGEHYIGNRPPLRFMPVSRSFKAARGQSLDVSTLRAARATMQIVDNAAQSLRAQRLAGLE